VAVAGGGGGGRVVGGEFSGSCGVGVGMLYFEEAGGSPGFCAPGAGGSWSLLLSHRRGKGPPWAAPGRRG